MAHSNEPSKVTSSSRGLRFGNIVLQPMDVPKLRGDHDIALHIADDGTRAVVSLQFNSALYDEPTGKRMVQHFANIVRSVASNPLQTIGEISMVGLAERKIVLDTRNRTHRPYDENAFIHQLVETRAKATPNAPAVVIGSNASHTMSSTAVLTSLLTSYALMEPTGRFSSSSPSPLRGSCRHLAWHS